MVNNLPSEPTADSLRVALILKSVIEQHAVVDVTDANGRIIEVNDRFCELFQFTRAEIIGRDHRLIGSGHHPPEFFELMWSKISKGAVWRGKIKNRAKNGSHVWVDTIIVPIVEADGDPHRYFAIRLNVTKGKDAEEALRGSEEQLRLALKGASAATWRWNLETGEMKWSPEAFALHGRESDSVRPSFEEWLASVHPDDRESVRNSLARALQSADSGYAAEYRVILPSAEIRWISALGTVERSREGKPLRVSGINLDITERKNADFLLRASELALRQSQARLHSAADAARLTYAEFDLVANSGSAADNYARVMGYTPLREDGALEVHAALARLIAHVAPEDRKHVQERIGAALSGRLPVVDAEYRVVGDDAAVRWIRSVGSAEAGPNGLPRRIFVTNLDVTEQVKGREALRRATERSEEILSSIADGFFALDAEWRFVYFNERAEALLGTPRDAALGRSFLDVFPTFRGSAAHANFARVMNERVPLQFELCVAAPDQWIFHSAYPTREGGLSVYFHDISEQKRIEREIAEARNEAVRANTAKSKFLAAASHDLRQPVQSLALLMDLARKQITANPNARATIAMMQKSLDGLNGLLNAILDISRFDSGLGANIEPVDLGAMLGQLAFEYRPKADKAGLALRLAAQTVWVSADPALLERAIRNLIENAIRYTHKGGVLIGLRRRHGRIRIDVVDTGIGVPAHRLHDIFEEFVQIDNPGRQFGLGLGLGLAIVSRIARLLGAEIEVKSVEGRGSRFSLFVPETGAAPALPDDVAPSSEGRSGRVLIVEDNAVVLSSLVAALTEWGFQTFPATSGEEALRVAEAESWRFGAIVADQHLGEGLSGVDTAKEIARRSGRQMPALILTGDTSKDGITTIAASGFQMMHKPTAPEALRRSLAQMISG